MNCNQCGIDIQYNTTRCPICGTPIDATALDDIYPKPAKAQLHKGIALNYSILALIVILAISLILNVVNIVTFTGMAWGIIVSLCLLLAYTVIAFFFNGKISLALRNFVSLVLAFATFYINGCLLESLSSVTFYLLPLIFISFALVNLFACMILDREKYMISSVVFGTLAFIPIILFFINIHISTILAIASACLGVIAIITPIIINRKRLKTFLSSFFHM